MISRDSRGEAAQVSPGTAAVRRASPGGALGGGVAGALVTVRRLTLRVRELDHVEQRERVQESGRLLPLLSKFIAYWRDKLLLPIRNLNSFPDSVALREVESKEEGNYKSRNM